MTAMTETEAVVEALAVATAARAREVRLWKQIRLLRLCVALLAATLLALAAVSYVREVQASGVRRVMESVLDKMGDKLTRAQADMAEERAKRLYVQRLQV